MNDETKPDLAISKSQQWLACSLRLMPKDKEEQIYETVVFDSSLAVLYKKQIHVDIPFKKFSPLNVAMTTDTKG